MIIGFVKLGGEVKRGKHWKFIPPVEGRECPDVGARIKGGIGGINIEIGSIGNPEESELSR